MIYFGICNYAKYNNLFCFNLFKYFSKERSEMDVFVRPILDRS